MTIKKRYKPKVNILRNSFHHLLFILLSTFIYITNTSAQEVMLLDIKPPSEKDELSKKTLLNQAEKLGLSKEDFEIKVSGLAVSVNYEFYEEIRKVGSFDFPYEYKYILQFLHQNKNFKLGVPNSKSNDAEKQFQNLKEIYKNENANQADKNKVEAGKLDSVGSALQVQKNKIIAKKSEFNNYLGQTEVDYSNYSSQKNKHLENKNKLESYIKKTYTLDQNTAIEINKIISMNYSAIKPIKINNKGGILNKVKESKPNRKTKKCKQSKKQYNFTELSTELDTCLYIKLHRDWENKKDLIIPIEKNIRDFILLTREYQENKSKIKNSIKEVDKKLNQLKRELKNKKANAPSSLGFEVTGLDKELKSANYKIESHKQRVRSILSQRVTFENNMVLKNEMDKFRHFILVYFNEIAKDQMNKGNVEFTKFNQWHFSIPNNMHQAAFFYQLSSNLKMERFNLLESPPIARSQTIEVSQKNSIKLPSNYKDEWERKEYVAFLALYFLVWY